MLWLPQPACSYDVVFSNWLLMYLSDEEVEALAVKILGWVSEAQWAGQQCEMAVEWMCSTSLEARQAAGGLCGNLRAAWQ